MKKIFIILLLLLFTACSSETSTESASISESDIARMNETGLFDNCEKMDDELLEINRFKTEDFEELTVYSSESAEDASMYVIAMPAEGQLNDCKAQIEYYIETRFSAYLDYNPEAAKLIEDKLVTEHGSYLVYIISTDNELAFTELTK